MKETILAATAAIVMSLATGFANAEGCAKGAVVGGHFLGHHGVLGAAGGCADGVHEAKKKAAREQTASNSVEGMNRSAAEAAPVAGTTVPANRATQSSVVK